jgi:hypothetical protein
MLLSSVIQFICIRLRAIVVVMHVGGRDLSEPEFCSPPACGTTEELDHGTSARAAERSYILYF